MARLTFLVCLAVLGLARGDAPAQVSKVQTQSKEQAKSKEQAVAEQRLHEAEHARQEAVNKMWQAMGDLEDAVARSKAVTDGDVDSTVAAIEQVADDTVEDESAKAQAEFNKRLDEIQKSGVRGFTPEDLVEKAHQAARSLDRVDAMTMRATTHAMKQMQKDQIEKIRALGKTARDAATAALKSAFVLEHAQRKAGVKEMDYEAEFDANEASDESMQDRSQDLFDHGQDLIERFFDSVEMKMEKHWSRFDDLSDQYRESIRESIRAAEKGKQGRRDSSKTKPEQVAPVMKTEDAAAKSATDAQATETQDAGSTAADQLFENMQTKMQSRWSRLDEEVKSQLAALERTILEVKKSEADVGVADVFLAASGSNQDRSSTEVAGAAGLGMLIVAALAVLVLFQARVRPAVTPAPLLG